MAGFVEHVAVADVACLPSTGIINSAIIIHSLLTESLTECLTECSFSRHVEKGGIPWLLLVFG